MENTLSGGCLCQAVRYRLTGKPFATEYCHCRMCQKQSGAPAAAWMDVEIGQISWEKEAVKEYASSEHVRRGFCAHCGSTLTFRDTRHPNYLTLALTSLDDPEPFAPERHIYTQSQLNWHDTRDSCPRFTRGPGPMLAGEPDK